MRTLIKKSIYPRLMTLIAGLVLPLLGFSQDPAAAPASAGSTVDYTMAYVLIVVMLLLLLIIWILTKLLETSSDYFLEKWKKESRDSSNAGMKAVMVLALALTGFSSMAQAPAATSSVKMSELIGGLPPFLFYMMACLIFIEFVVIMVLISQIRTLMLNKVFFANGESEEVAKAETIGWWEKFNGFKPIASEADLDLGHDYDGIRELNNRLPKWWLYGFYFTILSGVIYLYRFHVSHSGLSNIEEYEASVVVAEKAKAANMHNSGVKIDETNVTLRTEADQIAAGLAVFKQNCVVCHGDKGQGLVGPNLTDNFWIYGGDIKDVFKTIKYGTNKGMQSWKENLNAEKMAQVASYIKSIGGSNPPNPKAPQGEPYVEKTEAAAPATDSTATK